MKRNANFIAILFVAAALCPTPARTASCERLTQIALKDTAITLAEDVKAGAFTVTGAGAERLQLFKTLPAFCRVAGVIKPSADSNINFEVWLPQSGWNGKFQGVGNGGFAGSINYADGGMAAALSLGYATASTDTGHQGNAVDAKWALGHPEKITDFGYRAIHLMTQDAQEIVRTFYGRNPRRSYFGSCSNGGRQALMEAQRFPADYDGILAGAPANFWTHLLTEAVWNSQATLTDAASYIARSKLPAIEAATLAACDALDGVKDGVIDDPTKCKFDPSTLLCSGPESDVCLTQAQVTALKKIYAGPRNSRGEQIYPGDFPGAETGRGGWALWITGPQPRTSLQYSFGTQFFQNMMFNDPNWDFRTLNFDRDIKPTDNKMAPILNATEANLKDFRDRGGKLILYHGWDDAAISPQNSVNYYRSVVAKMGRQDADAFLRLYMLPGVQHCDGGPGPDIPNSLERLGIGRDPDRDIVSALERWVERGVAPETIIATKYKAERNPKSGAARTRPLCPYPQTARYKGAGSTDETANFVCTVSK
ncbi:MAG: tannase/feruloyl esterase family alpha/beta hydrolase [Bryobacteraceae bacterium]